MKFQNIPEFLEYSNFEIVSEVGTHTICNVVFVINPEKADDFLSSAENRTKINVFSDSNDCLLKGFISEADISYGITLTTAKVTIISESLLIQEKGKERIYQNPDKTFSDILKNYPEVEIGKCDHINDVVEPIIYQHNMDDFSFLLYLANRCETGLWITDDGKISFGMINNTKTLTDSETAYQKSILSKSIIANKKTKVLNITSMVQIPNGSTLKYNQSDYIVCSVRVYEECDETYFEYTAVSKLNKALMCNIQPLITKAKVVDNKDSDNFGRIKVEFTEFEDKSSDKVWIPYLTNFVGKNQGGIVMLPDVDDEVIVLLSDDKAYIIGSIRHDSIPDNCSDVEKKHISIKDSVITLNEEELIFKQGEKTVATLKADNIALEHEKSIITLDDSSVYTRMDKSESKITSDEISSKIGKTSLILKSDSLIAENSKGKLEIKSDNSTLTGGKSQLKLDNGKSKLSGSNIDLSTQGVSI